MNERRIHAPPGRGMIMWKIKDEDFESIQRFTLMMLMDCEKDKNFSHKYQNVVDEISDMIMKYLRQWKEYHDYGRPW